MAQPYIKQPLTGESMTRDFVKKFLWLWVQGTDKEEADQYVTPYFDRIYGTTAPVIETLFEKELRGGYRRNLPVDTPEDRSWAYGGRRRVRSAFNPWETLLCFKIDIQRAAEQLPKDLRIILGLRYVGGYSPREIAQRTRRPEKAVRYAIERGLDLIALMLDHGLGVEIIERPRHAPVSVAPLEKIQPKKVCENPRCRREFEPTVPWQVHCTAICRSAAHYQTNRLERIAKARTRQLNRKNALKSPVYSREGTNSPSAPEKNF